MQQKQRDSRVNKANQKKVEIIEYLKNPLKVEELKSILEQLNIATIRLVRQQDSIWKEKFKGRKLSNLELLQAICKHPKIMERPIVTYKGKAIIGRPPENVLNIIYY